MDNSYRISITNGGVKVYDTVKKKVLWLSLQSFGKTLIGNQEFEYYPVPFGTYAMRVSRGDNMFWALFRRGTHQAVFYDRREGGRTNVKKAIIPVPHTMWFVTTSASANNRITAAQVYALNSLPDNAGNFNIHQFPFPNTSDGGRGICFGSNDISRININELPDRFWDMPFTPELAGNLVDGYHSTWNFLEDLVKDKFKEFPYKKLVSIDNFKSFWQNFARHR